MTAQREAFEAQRRRFEAGATKSGWRIGRIVDDEYHDPLMRSMFSAWQAAEATMLTAEPVAWIRPDSLEFPTDGRKTHVTMISIERNPFFKIPLYTKETP